MLIETGSGLYRVMMASPLSIYICEHVAQWLPPPPPDYYNAMQPVSIKFKGRICQSAKCKQIHTTFSIFFILFCK